jgi:indole-3-glycerol phosphate synthase
MGASLEQILAATRQRVEQSLASLDLYSLRQQAQRHLPRGFRRALEKSVAAHGMAIIAELKRASPSKGMIRGTFPVAGLAAELERAGASALSVLTEEEFFYGSLANLCEASAATQLPCLRKDFILHEAQIIEARANRADAILLIVAALNDAELTSLSRAAGELQLDVLCEVHDELELVRALKAGCDLIGVNSRDLRTFRVDHEVFRRLAAQIPEHALRVAESGISSGRQISELYDLGYHAFLVGESLMRAESPGAALGQLIAEFKPQRVAGD